MYTFWFLCETRQDRTKPNKLHSKTQNCSNSLCNKSLSFFTTNLFSLVDPVPDTERLTWDTLYTTGVIKLELLAFLKVKINEIRPWLKRYHWNTVPQTLKSSRLRQLNTNGKGKPEFDNTQSSILSRPCVSVLSWKSRGSRVCVSVFYMCVVWILVWSNRNQNHHEPDLKTYQTIEELF